MVKPPHIPESGPLKRYAEAINRVSDFAASMQILRGKSYRVRKTTSGQLLDFEKAKETQTIDGLVIQRFYIYEESDDYLDCLRADTDGNPYGDLVKVAKPMALRVSTYHGQSNSDLGGVFTISYQSSSNRRFTDSDGRYWDEVLWPPYLSGDTDIYACEPDGGTGLTVSGTVLTWLDMNLNARHFRPKMTQLATCVVENGVNVVKYIYVSGGPVQA